MKFPVPALDPRSRLLCAFFLSIAIACLGRVESAIFALLFAICLLSLSRASWKWRLGRIGAANVFIVFIWLFTPWTTPGNTVWQWGILHITGEGVNLALLATIKANAIVCVFLALAAPLSISQWGWSLHRLKLPDKLIWLFLFMGGNIFILRSQWQALAQAAKLRGFRMRASLRAYRTIASMIAILLVRAHDRAQRAHEALLLRGFTGRLPYACQSAFGIGDAILASTALMCIILLYSVDIGVINVF